MKTNLLRFLFFALVFLFLIAGCGGKQGPQGPAGTNGTNGTNGAQGSQGPQGPQGPQGSAGSNGTNGTNGTSLHVVDANGNDMGILVDEYSFYYNVYNTTANIFFMVLKNSGSVMFDGIYGALWYTSSNCTDSGTIYIGAADYTTNDLIVDNEGHCFSITTTTPANVSVSSSQSIANGQQVSCYSLGGSVPVSVYPANQITCTIPTQYAAPVNVKVE